MNTLESENLIQMWMNFGKYIKVEYKFSYYIQGPPFLNELWKDCCFPLLSGSASYRSRNSSSLSR